MLKNLALKYVAKQDEDGNVDEDGFKDYVRFFGGPKCEDRYRYDKVQVKKQDSPKKNMGYTAYNLNVLGYEEFAKRVELLFKDTDAVNDPQYKTMMEALSIMMTHISDSAILPRTTDDPFSRIMRELSLMQRYFGVLIATVCNISAPFLLKYLWRSGLLFKLIVFLVLLLIPSSSCSYS